MTAGIDLSAELELKLGPIHTELGKLRRTLEKPPASPVFARRNANVVAPASGFSVADLGGPAQGQRWNVLRLFIGGVVRTTTAAGSADIFIGTFDARLAVSLAALGSLDEIDFATALPNTAYWSRGQAVVQYGEKLFVAFSGMTNAQQYVANASIEIVEDAAMPQVSAV